MKEYKENKKVKFNEKMKTIRIKKENEWKRIK